MQGNKFAEENFFSFGLCAEAGRKPIDNRGCTSLRLLSSGCYIYTVYSITYSDIPEPPAGHPRGKLDRQLALSRVHRLLRPLRTAVHHLTAQLDSDAASVASKNRPASRRSLVDEDGDWSASSSSNNNKRSGSTSKRRRTSGAAQTTARGGGKRVSDAGASSPFGPGWRRTLGRTTKKYGSKAGAATAASGLDPASTATVSTAAYEDDLVTVDDLIARLRRNSSDSGVSVVLVQRAEQLLRAYANILEAVYAVGSSSSHTCEPTDKGKARERVPTLVELSARQVGASLEENVRACLDLDHLSEDSDSERETVTVEIRSTTSRGMERTASAQEAQLEASRVQDEWYEACPASTWRWILAEHATAIVVDASHVRMPFPLVDACYQLCLMYRAEQEASRFYLPLIETALYGSSGHILPLLRSSPSPRHLVDAALLPTLLDSAFADRLFYKSFLSLASLPVGMRLRSGEDVYTTAVLLAGLMHVARHMLAAISSTARAEDLDPDSVGRMVDEVCRRVATQLRAAMPLWMASGGMEDGDLESLRSAFEDLGGAFAELDAVSGAMREVLELGIVVELGLAPSSLDDRLEALSLRLASLVRSDSSSSSSSSSFSDSDADASDSMSLRDSSTLIDTLSRFLCPHRSVADIFQLCDQLGARYGTRTVGRDLVAVLLRATLAAKGSEPTVREQVERRLGARSRSPASGAVERRMARAATPADPEPDSTDYDEQPVLSQRRRPRPGGKRTRRWALSESPSEDRRSSSVDLVEPRLPSSLPTRLHLARGRLSLTASDTDDLDLLHSARRHRHVSDRSALLLSPSPEQEDSPCSRSPPPPPPQPKVPRPLSFSAGPPSPSPPLLSAPLPSTNRGASCGRKQARVAEPKPRSGSRAVDSDGRKGVRGGSAAKVRLVGCPREVLARRCWGDISSEDELAM